ncbi:hypothetical protein CENSYa_0661 [Cenarchaeum symbiosum A]|uniref:Uncharacterized protein n=1 Tax=Cenarchaeum symbiosum (strain A) TaxID=414004 RepID=A0RVC7_CENSY|nr:hypothetical protein CENSYa_0661 [Cenarchaeum symbiosum A]
MHAAMFAAHHCSPSEFCLRWRLVPDISPVAYPGWYSFSFSMPLISSALAPRVSTISSCIFFVKYCSDMRASPLASSFTEVSTYSLTLPSAGRSMFFSAQSPSLQIGRLRPGIFIFKTQGFPTVPKPLQIPGR